MKLAPIVLFVYNRPDHTLKTLQALQCNTLASQSTLHIFADGPKENASATLLENINAVRTIIASEQWCGEVILHESSVNKGLYRSVRDGVTEIVEHAGRVIVMEDDLQTSPAFLSYMNHALEYYEGRKSVFSISGYNYPSSKMQIPDDYPYDTYVSLRNASWGWATWKDRWAQVDWDVTAYKKISTSSVLQKALNRMGDDEYEMLQMQQEGGLNIWSIQFTIAHFVNHAIAIYPTVSYVHNIGNDGSGENCGTTYSLDNNVLCTLEQPRLIDILCEDKRLINAFYNVNCRRKRPLWQKAINFFARKFGKKAPFMVKGKVYA